MGPTTRHRAIRATIVGACAAALAACSGLFEPDGPKLHVSLSVQRPSAGGLVLDADVGGQRVRLASDGGSQADASVETRGPRYGAVPVRVVLRSAAGDSLAGVAFTHRFDDNSSHWVSARVGAHRPFGHCIGSVATSALRGGGTDTLFVMYGGIPDGAIC